ncbi:MAG: hypothetical protein K0Q79_447 [Flavipsychrobacter sp.]|jgi:hypothetical protein|nr:hypothetical protein [Flavipsychrobacter sp.]
MRILLLILTIFYLSTSLCAQGIKGLVVDEKKEPLINSVVQIYQNGVQKGGVVTDFNGLYTISPLDTGKYFLLFSYPGYDSVLLINASVTNKGITTVDCQLKRSANIKIISCPIIKTYKVPLIDMDNPSKRTYDREEIRRMPY